MDAEVVVSALLVDIDADSLLETWLSQDTSGFIIHHPTWSLAVTSLCVLDAVNTFEPQVLV